MQVTNGKVLYNRTVRPADFESKAFGVELSFTAPDGGSVTIDQVEAISDQAQALVHRKLGIRTAQAAVASLPAAPEAGVATSLTPAAPASTHSSAEKPKTKKQLEAEAKAAAAPKGKDPDVIEVDPPTKKADDELVLDAEPAAKLISDADLTSAASRRNQELGEGGGAKVRDLMAEFKPAGHKTQFMLKDVPQERRQEFLDRLKALV